ncbi:MAG: hypothetical protein A2Z51_03580 [Deltaproteobacteria bacterium RBG_19FT_COMBO_52_11]|nr:MAG: hypothetical protein A2Z51_03580 [Deltaproteobacteria bacterium RBG_19FT_COMBO_52_11]
MVNLTLLYIHTKAVIPAEAGIQRRNAGFRVKPGMTIREKRFMIHYPNAKRLTKRPALCALRLNLYSHQS